MIWHTVGLLFGGHETVDQVTLLTNAHQPPPTAPTERRPMDKATASPRWFSGWRTPVAPAQADPADLGTAFGLDMSLLDPHPAPAPATSVVRQPGWMQRLTARGKRVT